ncbi:MAG: glycosyltransferase [Proteobacteria bacterium]|nr:glycosyltransferase [Pseudomonadota bacterium]
MARKSKPITNVLMYSHDTYGLGHIRRTLAIASALAGPQVNVLILTGSPIAGRFSLPPNVDFVRIPGMIKKTNEEYQPLAIRIHPEHALAIRKNIITSTAKAFAPHLFIVDKEPLGLKKEVLPTLQWIASRKQHTRTILGLRDVMDEAEVVRADWTKRGVYEVLEELYSEIWVYGNRNFYDPVAEYAMERVQGKMHFTGYIPRKVPDPASFARARSELRCGNGEPLVVVTAGGGGDGYELMDAYLSMLEAGPVPFRSILVTGPFMPAAQRAVVMERARRVGARTHGFYRRMEKLMAASDLVVSMGGYNTVCEILSQKRLSLLIPREVPRKEQLIRAQALHGQHLVDYLDWGRVNRESLREKILFLLGKPEEFTRAINRFALTGLDAMRQRVGGLLNPS